MEFLVDQKHDGVLLRSYLKGTCGVSSRLLTQLKKRPEGITVNGNHVTVRYILRAGDRLRIASEDSISQDAFPAVELPFTILYEDSDLLIVDKPANMPTHMLQDPDQWITKAGRILRKTSLDELPQILSIFTGKMSIIGPRPALWNQDDLIAERDKYGANDVKPGLTGWAQINGRDELEIPLKARLDGDYTAALNAGFFRGLAMDVKCFFGTIISVLKSDGVVEGGTGEMEKIKVQKDEIEKL